MMKPLDLNELVYERDKDGNLLPVTVPVPRLNRTVSFIPLALGEFNELRTKTKTDQTSREEDARMIEDHFTVPKVKAEDLLKAGNFRLIPILIDTLFSYSGIEIGTGEVSEPKELSEDEVEKKK